MITFADLEELAEWMRKRGATYVRLGDTELQLAPRAPPGPPEPPRALTDEEVIARGKRQQERQERLLFASSEGLPIEEDDEL